MISSKIELCKLWKIQSSKHISQPGNVLSTHPELSNEWFSAEVPSTVLGTLVANRVFENPYFGENLKTIPTEPFKMPWWYVTSFELRKEQADAYAELNFDGINYKANVWMNGKQIADITTIDGAFRRTSFDISPTVVSGTNTLAIEVIPPKPGDFSTGFVDWNPAPPDGNMGIFRPVTLHLHRGIQIKNPFVETRVDLNTLKQAWLTISADLQNTTDRPISGRLTGKIGVITFDRQLTLTPNSTNRVVFSPDEHTQLHIHDPRLWWPIHMGNPELYELDLHFTVEEDILDTAQVRFGIREIEDYWINDVHRGFKVNGRKVLIKGGGWTDDLFLMDTDEGIEAQVNYVKQMNLNTIRLEGFWGKDHKLYDLCDEHGILLMVGWSCHWEHEIHMGVPVNERFGGVYTPDAIDHVAQAWEDQVVWLRNHPSIFVWTVASDKVPITELEKRYIATFAKYDSTRPYLNSTGGVGSDQHVIGSEDVISEISGSSGVKMLGPYAYTAPIYWYTDTNFGGAYGFNTETGPGAQVPQLRSLQKMIPEDRLWPINDIWDYHCGKYEFTDLSRFTKAIDERYGKPQTLKDFDKKAQAMNYELMRPMFEAFQIHKDRATGVIQWMLNAAWPKMYWQLYDYYLMPTGAFYATQKACAPLHLAYNYGDRHIYAINDHDLAIKNLKAHIRVFDIRSTLLLDKSIVFDMGPDASKSLYQIEDLKGLTATYFIDLRLRDSSGKEMGNNFYWLSTKEEILDYDADLGDFAYHTPSKVYADLTKLNALKTIEIKARYEIDEGFNGKRRATVTLENTATVIAFLLNLNIVEWNTEAPILPVFWEDNFISLLPGEKRTLSATFETASRPVLTIDGWNVKKQQL